MAQRLKCLPAVWETRVRSPGWEDPLEKKMATHSSILAWRIPWREEPGVYGVEKSWTWLSDFTFTFILCLDSFKVIYLFLIFRNFDLINTNSTLFAFILFEDWCIKHIWKALKLVSSFMFLSDFLFLLKFWLSSINVLDFLLYSIAFLHYFLLLYYPCFSVLSSLDIFF